MHGIGERQAARTGDGQMHGLIRATKLGQTGAHIFKQSLHCGAHVRMMTPVVRKQRLIKRIIEHHGLDRGRADVKANAECGNISGIERVRHRVARTNHQ